jgi:outer membrane lipoprotein-sorting protein
MRLMRKYTIAAALLLCVLSQAAATVCVASPTTEVEKYLNGLATWSADFKQTIDDGHGNVVRSAAGKLYLQKPGS